MPDEAQHICAACKAVFIELMNVSPGSQSVVRHSINYTDVQQSATYERACVTCAFLSNTEQDEDDALFDEQSDPGAEAYAYAFFTFKPIWEELDTTQSTVSHGFDELEIHLCNEDGKNLAWHGRTRLIRMSDSFPVATMIGRPQQSLEDLVLAKSWIRHCASSHTDCPDLIAKPLPTRLIEVQDADIRKLRLISGSGRAGQYTALSHCWGKMKPLVVTKSRNLEAHYDSLDYNSLPANFRDAVNATITLGYSLVWIDSICIVQDDPQDWERECVRMGDVYANAVVTISASKAQDSTTGFLGDRPPVLKESCQISILLPFSDNSLKLALVRQSTSPRSDFFTNEPLMSRGWVMQERLLTPRILHFSERQLIFECNQCRAHEDLQCSIIPDKTALFVPKSFLNVDDKFMLFDRWYTILESYSWKYLTYGSDRLPALSGIASHFSRKTGCTYMAGLWLEDLKGLAWVSSNNLEKWKYVRRNRDELAPSWTWMSCETPVGFAFRNLWLGQGPWSDEAIIQSARLATSETDQYGRVRSGILTISGYGQMVEIPGRHARFEEHVRRRDGEFRNDSEETYAHKGFLLPGAFGVFINLPLGSDHCAMSFYPDDNDEWQAEASRMLQVLLLGSLKKPNSTEVEGWVGIGLHPVDSKRGTYRRMGIIMNTSGLPGKGYEDIVSAAVSLGWLKSSTRHDFMIH